MSKVKLILPNIKYKRSYLSATKDPSFSTYIKDFKKMRSGYFGGIKRTEYWLVNNKKYLGKIQIRHSPLGKYENLKSHIYYEIIPNEQNKGYGGNSAQTDPI